MENISNSLVLQLSDVVLSPGSYVSTPRLDLHATSFTIATNVWLDSTENRNILLGNWSSNKNAWQLLFGIQAGGLPFISLRKDLPTNGADPTQDLVGIHNLKSNISVNAKQWTHVAITFDWGVDYISPTATLYVDGKAAGSVSPQITPDSRVHNLYTLKPSPNSYLIGRKEDGGTARDAGFAGQLKDFRIYTTALTSDAILQLISATPQANSIIAPSGRLWAIQQNGVWTRWASEPYSRWDIYSEPRIDIAADPSTPSACYFINPDGTVHWRDVDRNINKSFPGIAAKTISVGGNGRLWAIQQNGVWTRWASEPYSRWDIYSETRMDIAADPSTPSACYFINPDGTVHWRDVDNNVNKSFPGIVAKAISV